MKARGVSSAWFTSQNRQGSFCMNLCYLGPTQSETTTFHGTKRTTWWRATADSISTNLSLSTYTVTLPVEALSDLQDGDSTSDFVTVRSFGMFYLTC
jgi:hypothetical protein